MCVIFGIIQLCGTCTSFRRPVEPDVVIQYAMSLIPLFISDLDGNVKLIKPRDERCEQVPVISFLSNIRNRLSMTCKYTKVCPIRMCFTNLFHLTIAFNRFGQKP